MIADGTTILPVVKETDVEKPVRIVSPNGEVYVGEIVSGKPHGQDKLNLF